MKILLSIIAFIVLTTVNIEYLINRQSSTLLLLLSAAIEFGLIYTLIVPFIKKLIKK